MPQGRPDRGVGQCIAELAPRLPGSGKTPGDPGVPPARGRKPNRLEGKRAAQAPARSPSRADPPPTKRGQPAGARVTIPGRPAARRVGDLGSHSQRQDWRCPDGNVTVLYATDI